MARIPQEVLKRIEAEVSVVRLAELAGVELHPDGEELSGPLSVSSRRVLLAARLAHRERLALHGGV